VQAVGRLSQNLIYRHEVRIGHLRRLWHSHTAMCWLWALFIGLWSFFEMVTGALGPRWSQPQAEILSGAFLFTALVLGPTHLALSLLRDVRTKLAESLIAAGVSPEDYLRGKLLGAVRPTFILFLALWFRWLLIRVRFDSELGQLAGLGERSLVMMELVSASIGFFAGCFVWALGILCYAALTMLLTLRWRGAWTPIVLVGLLAFAVDVWLPALAQAGFPRWAGRLSDTLIAALLVSFTVSVFIKWVLYLHFFDRSVEHFGEWALE
jgi:hypothetical protein